MAKLTESLLRKIIKEELRKVVKEAWTQPEDMYMDANEIKQILKKTIDSGNAMGVKEIADKFGYASGDFIALNNHFDGNVILVPATTYANVGKQEKSGGKQFFDRIRQAAYAVIPYEVANNLTKQGLKVF